jgi:D-alanine-D-alanine ligase
MSTRTNKTIGVIFGGRSAEHEVSVITGHQAMDALDAAGFDVLPIYISKVGSWFAGEPLRGLQQYRKRSFDARSLKGAFQVSLSPDTAVRQLIPAGSRGAVSFSQPPRLWADVFFPTIHGSFGEDGTIQGLLELADVPYVGSGVAASAAAIDKVRTKALCSAAGVPTLPSFTVSRGEWRSAIEPCVKRVEMFCKYPVIVKPVHLGSSVGVSRCAKRNELTQALELALRLDDRALIERALEDFIEINCAVLGPPERASVCEQPRATTKLLSFDDKYKRGTKKTGRKSSGRSEGMAALERMVPAPISTELTTAIQNFAIDTFRAVGAFGVARVDFLYEQSSNTLFMNEINTLPGSLAFYLWEESGLSFDGLVMQLVTSAIERHRERSLTQFSFDANLLAAGDTSNP